MTYKSLIIITLTAGLYAFTLPDASDKDKNKTGRDKAEMFNYGGRSYKPGDTVLGYKTYIKLVVGDHDAPLLLGVPHDGTAIGSPEIPETGKTGRDINTLPLAFKIADAFRKSTKKRPWIIINTIGRKRVDPNTFPHEVDARYKNEDARETYKSYHDLLSAARQQMAEVQKNGKGAFYLDLHGHAHRYVNDQPYISANGRLLNSKFIDQTELGYGLSTFTVSQNDQFLDKVADSSSISSIAKANPNVPFSEILRGAFSFGGLLEAEKIKAVPSPAIPVFEANEELFGKTEAGEIRSRPYFNGGYCTRQYGTIRLGKTTTGFDDNIFSIQAEVPGITVRNNPAIIEISGERFNKAIIKYLNKWCGYSF